MRPVVFRFGQGLSPAADGEPAAGDTPRVRALIALFRTWCERHLSRQELAEMDERTLRDIGLSRAAALLEAAKPFWRA